MESWTNSQKVNSKSDNEQTNFKENKEVAVIVESLSVRRETIYLSQILLRDVAVSGSAKELLNLILSRFESSSKILLKPFSKSMENLPVIHRKIFGLAYLVPRMYKHWNGDFKTSTEIQYRLSNPLKLSKMKSTNSLTPDQ